jgi:HSP20 family molecular chaperone IbpA
MSPEQAEAKSEEGRVVRSYELMAAVSFVEGQGAGVDDGQLLLHIKVPKTAEEQGKERGIKS